MSREFWEEFAAIIILLGTCGILAGLIVRWLAV